MKVLILITLLNYLTACEACKESYSCAQDDHSKTNEAIETETEETTETKTDVVVTNSESLPLCDDLTKNLTAYKESKDKYFICKDGAWEEFNFKNTKSDLDLVWDKSKETLPTDEFLDYTCGIILSIDPKHLCNAELNNETD